MASAANDREIEQRAKARRRRRATVMLVSALAAGCGRATQPSLDDEARQYVRLAVALGERDVDSLDFYAGPAGAVADLRRAPPTLAAIRRDAGLLASRLRDRRLEPAATARQRALTADLDAMIARVDLLTGVRLPYDRESSAFFGVAPGEVDAREVETLRSRIADLVGRDGRLVDRYAAFAARFTVPAERLPDVLRLALDECRRRTIAHVTLPPGERVTLEFVSDKPWSAFSRYLGHAASTIQINTDFRFTVDQALQVACHEGYPGHHTRNALQAPREDAAGVAPERTVQLMFSPEALASEASAMLATALAFPPGDRVEFVRDRLFPAAGLDAADVARHLEAERLVGDLQIVQADVARRYLDGRLEFARAVAALEDQALVPHAEALVKYINQYRSYVTAYTAGPRLRAAQLSDCAGPAPAAATRWRCFTGDTSSR